MIVIMYYKKDNDTEICQWCYKRMSKTLKKSIYVDLQYARHPVCSKYCKTRYLYKIDNIRLFSNSGVSKCKVDTPVCVVCCKEDSGLWGFSYNNNYFCGGLHMDIYQCNDQEITALINKKKQLLQELKMNDLYITNFGENLKK